MFRPCIDLHNGKVKQIVGGTLTDDENPELQTNFTSEHPPAYFAELYQKDQLTGGHVIKLGPGNEEAALSALKAYPNGLQIGGGVNADNAQKYLDAGATHVIVTSYVFKDGKLNQENLDKIFSITGKEKLILDLSCRIKDGKYYIVTDRWQKFTNLELNAQTLQDLSAYCDEFLIHAVDVEGLCNGVDYKLVQMLADHSPIFCTYAGGARSVDDLHKIQEIGQGKLALTIGSALDIFGGSLIKYQDAVDFNNKLK